MTFPREHRAKLHSNNRIERLNGEVKRRTTTDGPSNVPGTCRWNPSPQSPVSLRAVTR